MGKLLLGNCLDILKDIDNESVDMCVTSPPYYGLRDYGTGRWVGGDENCEHRPIQTGSVNDSASKTVCKLCDATWVDNQIGIENTPEEYINKLVHVFREVYRILKDDGTLWVNIGDSYNGSGGNHTSEHKNDAGFQGSVGERYGGRGNHISSCKPKDLIGIPWMLAFALRSDGWYLRQDIIFHKKNPMPESVKDRCTKSHEYLFLLSKKPHYYFDYEAIQEIATGYDGRNNIFLNGSLKYNTDEYLPGEHRQTISSGGKERWKFKTFSEYSTTSDSSNIRSSEDIQNSIYPVRHKRDVWSITTKPVKEAHFATFPEELIVPCILAGSRVGGIILDPFFGSGTTGVVAKKLRRDYIGVELNKEYVQIAESRLNNTYVQFDLFSDDN